MVIGALDIPLDQPRGPMPSPIDRVQSGMTTASRSKAVGMIAELRLVIRFQQGAYHFLQQFVGPRGQAQCALLGRAFLLDVDASHRGPAVPFVPEDRKSTR